MYKTYKYMYHYMWYMLYYLRNKKMFKTEKCLNIIVMPVNQGIQSTKAETLLEE